jgi:hypothetical protein
MSTEITDLLRQMFHFQVVAIVLVVGLYGYAIYGTIVITRLLRESQDLTREVLRRLPEQG